MEDLTRRRSCNSRISLKSASYRLARTVGQLLPACALADDSAAVGATVTLGPEWGWGTMGEVAVLVVWRGFRGIEREVAHPHVHVVLDLQPSPVPCLYQSARPISVIQAVPANRSPARAGSSS